MSSVEVPPTARISSTTPIKAVMADLPVTAAPEGMPDASGKATTEAKVTAYDSKSQVLKLLTPEGEVSVKTPLPLKAGTELNLELTRSADGRLTATLTPQRAAPVVDNTPQQPRPTPQTPAAPPPPLRPGDATTAIFIDERPQVTTPAPATSVPLSAKGAVSLSPAEVSTIINQIKSKGTGILPDMSSETADLLNQIMAKPSPLAALASLSQADQEALMTLFAQMQQPEDETMSALLFGSQPAPSQSKPVAGDAISTFMHSLLPLLQGADVPTGPQVTPQQGIAQLTAQLPQNMFRISIESLIAPGQTVPQLQPGQTSGIVERLTTEGAAVIRIADGLFILDAKKSLPVGTTVIFNAEIITPEQLLTTLSATAKTLTPTGFMWPALQESLDTLSVAAPEIALLLRNTLPAAGEKFTATAMFFMAALKSGNIGNWLGENTLNMLRQTGKKGLMERLADDFGSLSKQSNAGGSEWRGISMPLLHDDHISMMQFFVRHQPLPVHEDSAHEEQEGPKQMTRFILNFNLSRMGDIQLDGLVQKSKMDMILRTTEALPFSSRQDIMQAYTRGIEQTEMQGSISFQTKKQQWIEMPHPALADSIKA